MKTFILPAAFVAALGTATAAQATTISASASIVETGQDISFATAAPDYTGGAGQLTITLNGDFSYNFRNREYAAVTLPSLAGQLMLANDPGRNNVTSNTISGLSLVSSSATETLRYYDALIEYTFDISADAMAELLADDVFDMNIALGPLVNPNASYDEDYVSFALSYTDLSAETLPAVPLPASAPLLLAAVGGFGMLRRRKKTT